jgi:hypothetical protein
LRRGQLRTLTAFWLLQRRGMGIETLSLKYSGCPYFEMVDRMLYLEQRNSQGEDAQPLILLPHSLGGDAPV